MGIVDGVLSGVTNENINDLGGHFAVSEEVTSIGAFAFANCTSLTALTIPKGVKHIGRYAFSGCTSLTALTIPEGDESIGVGAFYGCTSLTALTIPKSVTSIGAFAFANCTSLTALAIPKSVTSIGDSAFDGCTSLTALTIPKSVTSIGYGAFYGCEILSHIVVDDDGDSSELDRIKTLLPPELHSKVVSKQHMAETQAAEANQNFRLNCLITIGISSAIILTALVMTMTTPSVTIATGVVAATSSVVGLTSFGLYANNKWDSDALAGHGDTPAEALP